MGRYFRIKSYVNLYTSRIALELESNNSIHAEYSNAGYCNIATTQPMLGILISIACNLLKILLQANFLVFVVLFYLDIGGARWRSG